jgi:hypothetical protein
MHKPRLLDQIAIELGDRYAFASRFARGRRPFQPAHVEPQWARDRSAAIKHIRLEVALDFERKRIAGTAAHRLARGSTATTAVWPSPAIKAPSKSGPRELAPAGDKLLVMFRSCGLSFYRRKHSDGWHPRSDG